MTDLDTYKFSCGHQFSMLKTENNTNLKQRTAWVCKRPQSLPDPCHECRKAEREAEEKKKGSINQVEAGIKAHKALADFLRLQILSSAAENDPALKLSFEKCQQETLKKHAELAKESLLKSTWLGDQTLANMPFESKLKVIQERIRIIENFAVQNFLLEDEDAPMAKNSHVNDFDLWHHIKQDVTKLQDDYRQFYNVGFEKRLKQVLDKATELSK